MTNLEAAGRQLAAMGPKDYDAPVDSNTGPVPGPEFWQGAAAQVIGAYEGKPYFAIGKEPLDG